MEYWYRIVNSYRTADKCTIEAVEVDRSTQDFLFVKDGRRMAKLTDYVRYFPSAVEAIHVRYFPSAVEAIHDALASTDRARAKAKREDDAATAKAAVLRKLLEEQK